jgi:hypothetical protein
MILTVEEQKRIAESCGTFGGFLRVMRKFGLPDADSRKYWGSMNGGHYDRQRLKED